MDHKIYLAGPITGLTYEESEQWRDQFKKLVHPTIKCYSPLRGKGYLKKHGKLDGAYDEFPLSTSKGLTARDRYDCTHADVVVFNLLNASRISIGTMIEFGWADAHNIPTVAIMEPSSIHNHPMVEAIVNFRVTSLVDAAHIVNIILKTGDE